MFDPLSDASVADEDSSEVTILDMGRMDGEAAEQQQLKTAIAQLGHTMGNCECFYF